MTQSDSLRLKISFSFCSCLREISEFSGLPFKYKTKPNQYQDLGPGCLILRRKLTALLDFLLTPFHKKEGRNKQDQRNDNYQKVHKLLWKFHRVSFDGDPTIRKLPPNWRNPADYLVIIIIATVRQFVCDFRSKLGSLSPLMLHESLTEPLPPDNASDNFSLRPFYLGLRHIHVFKKTP